MGGSVIGTPGLRSGFRGHPNGDQEPDRTWSELTVAEEQKAKAKAEQAKGKAKETVGRAVGNERLTAEGRAQQSKGDARQAKEKTKDVFKH